MEAKDILEAICNHLDKKLKTNKSLIKIKETFLNVLEESEQAYYVMVNENIYDLVKEFQNTATIIPIPHSETSIFQFSSHETHDIEFSLRCLDDCYSISFETSMQNLDESFNVFNVIDINIIISDIISTWSITEALTSENVFYEAFNYELHSYNINNEELKIENEEDKKDNHFSDFLVSHWNYQENID